MCTKPPPVCPGAVVKYEVGAALAQAPSRPPPVRVSVRDGLDGGRWGGMARYLSVCNTGCGPAQRRATYCCSIHAVVIEHETATDHPSCLTDQTLPCPSTFHRGSTGECWHTVCLYIPRAEYVIASIRETSNVNHPCSLPASTFPRACGTEPARRLAVLGADRPRLVDQPVAPALTPAPRHGGC